MSPASERSHRTALLLSILLTFAGSCGAFNGAQRFNAGPPPSASLIEAGDGPGAAEQRELVAAMAETYVGAKESRPLGLANLVVSMMLVVGSFMLSTRRKNTVWFLTNALVANFLLIGAECVAMILRVQSRSGGLVRKFVAATMAQASPEHAVTLESATRDGRAMITALCFGVGFIALLKLAFHVFLLVRTRGADVAEFLAATPEE